MKQFLCGVLVFFLFACSPGKSFFSFSFTKKDNVEKNENSAKNRPAPSVAVKRDDKKSDDKTLEDPVVLPSLDEVLPPTSAPIPAALPPSTSPSLADQPGTTDSGPAVQLPVAPASMAPVPVVPVPVAPAVAPVPVAPKVVVPKSVGALPGDLPLKSFRHFGGIPTVLALRDKGFLAAFGTSLVWYDANLNPLGQLSLSAPVERLVSQGAGMFYVVEEGNNFDVVIIPEKGPARIVKSFEADGTIDVFSGLTRVFVSLPDKVQILDLGHLDQITSLGEINLEDVTQVDVLGNFVYGVSGTNLNLLELLPDNTSRLLARLDMGTSFSILGHVTEGDGVRLVLGFQTNDQWTNVRLLPLSVGGGGFADLGNEINFKEPLDSLVVDASGIGCFMRQSSAGCLNLKTGQELFSSLPGLADVVALAMGEGKWMVATRRELAEISFQGVVGKKVEYPGSVSRVLLPGGNVVVVENMLAASDAGATPFFINREFSGDLVSWMAVKSPLKDTFKTKFSLSFSTGILLAEEKSQKLYWLKSADPATLSEVKLEAQTISGLTAFADDKSTTLFVVGDQLKTYAFDPIKLTARALGTLAISEGGGAVVSGDGKTLFVACGGQGLCWVDVSQRMKMKLTGNVALPVVDVKAIDVALSPDGSLAYVLGKKEAEPLQIFVYDLTSGVPTSLSFLPSLDPSFSLEQFRGLTFSAGGKKLILPQSKGLAIYDMHQPQTPVLQFVWPMGHAFFAYVTGRGSIICAALGLRGVQCGSLENMPNP